MSARIPVLSFFAILAPAFAAIPAQSDGYAAFYNLDYDRALALFERETGQDPQNPEAWNHLAHALLHRRLFLEGAMSSELVGSSNSFLRRQKLNMPETEEKRFLEAVEKSIAICEQRLEIRREDPIALYAAGVAYAHRGKYHLLVRKAHFDALRDANRSRGFHNRLRKADPSNPDALLIPGMHEYIAGNLSFFVRMLAAMTGFSGNRERGIAMIEEASKRGKKTGVEARLLLALTYNREQKPKKALPLMRELSEAFPRNYLYRSEVLLLHARAGERDAAMAGLARMEADRNNPAPQDHLRNLRESIHRLLEDRTRS